MNGFEQIKSFYSWVFNNQDKVRPTHVSLYLFLWNQANRNMWVEWFKCPYDLAMQGACIGNKGTYYRCLDELQDWGLIKYKKGINMTKAPLISLIQLYGSVPLTGLVTVPLSEPQHAPQPEPLSVLLPVPIYKLITNNIELVSGKLEFWINSERTHDDNKILGFNYRPQYENTSDEFKKIYDKKFYDSWLSINSFLDEHCTYLRNWENQLTIAEYKKVYDRVLKKEITIEQTKSALQDLDGSRQAKERYNSVYHGFNTFIKTILKGSYV